TIEASTSAEMIMQTAFKLSTLAAAGVFLLSSIATPRAPETHRIGGFGPISRPAAQNGIRRFSGRRIARDLFNERGGVEGPKVELLLADIPTPTAAVSETERLITKEGVKITLGSGVSQLAIPVSQTAERHGVFHWETAGAADIITKRGFKYTFQVGPAAYR